MILHLHKSMRLVVVIPLILIASLVIAVCQFDNWLHRKVETYFLEKTHFKVSIGSLHTSLVSGFIDIQDISIQNSDEFPEPHFLNIHQLKAHLDWFCVFSNAWIFDELVIDIDRLYGVRNESGDVNILSFANALTAQESESGPEAQKKPITETKENFLIRRLIFRLNQVTVADYKGNKNDVRSARLNICRVINNVTSYEQVLIPIATDLSVFVSRFILDAIFQSTLDPAHCRELLPKVLMPLKNSMKQTLDRAKKDSQKLLQNLVPPKTTTTDVS